MRIDAMFECCFPFPVCFCFSPVGSGVDVSNESDVRINIDDSEDQYLSIDIQFKKKNPEDLFLFLVINEQGKRLILCFQSISILALSHMIQMSFIGS
jgi:hypothetical protein